MIRGRSESPDAPSWRLTFPAEGVVVPCPDGRSVLAAMEAGRRQDIPVGCRGGGCGVCKVQVLRGRYEVGRTSRTSLSVEEAAQGIALACRLYPQADLELRALGRRSRPRGWEQICNTSED